LSPRRYHSDYDEETTGRCERALLTLLGDLGPWRERIYLAGGLAPRYLVGQLPEGARAHVGTTDIDLVIGLALGDETPETYRTLKNNLEKARFAQEEPSFRWARDVDGIPVVVEFLCETDEVEPGSIFRPKGESTGSGLGAFNVRGAHLVRDDFVERAIVDEIEHEFLYADGDGFHFMNSQSYEQFTLTREILGEAVDYLIPNVTVKLEFYDGKPIGVALPDTVDLTVVETEPGIQKATASSVMKPAKMETGLVVQVPPFINVGDKIKVDTSEGRYIQRAQ